MFLFSEKVSWLLHLKKAPSFKGVPPFVLSFRGRYTEGGESYVIGPDAGSFFSKFRFVALRDSKPGNMHGWVKRCDV